VSSTKDNEAKGVSTAQRAEQRRTGFDEARENRGGAMRWYHARSLPAACVLVFVTRVQHLPHAPEDTQVDVTAQHARAIRGCGDEDAPGARKGVQDEGAWAHVAVVAHDARQLVVH
jgi:hypothetical protein